ncbi:LysR substrate-binding domain-containing protein [Janthinobacterium sp. GB4P2]|uniref:LysR substrate-binding domain-containing protein n=1 Tax=Janthinobacterium sp. GB4P2 TaxID=3424189 RepID=UPI003F218157
MHWQNDDDYGVWRLSRARATHTVKVRGTVSSNAGDVVPGWALDGHRILLRSQWDLARHLDSGRLRVVLADYALAPADLYAYYPSRHQLPAKVRAFINFLGQQLQPETATAGESG